MEKEQKIYLALGILSGRIDASYLDSDEYKLLGYDTYKFSYYGRPDEFDIKQKAENIIYDAIIGEEVK